MSSTPVNRRSVVKGSAWMLPTIALATAAPQAAASVPLCVPGTPPSNTASIALQYPPYIFNHGQTSLEDPFIINGWDAGNGFRFSGNTEMVNGSPEGVLAPFFEMDIRADFGKMTWVPDNATFAAGWVFDAKATKGPFRAPDGFQYYTYRFTTTKFFTNVGNPDPLMSTFRFAATPQDIWQGAAFGPIPTFTSQFRAHFPTRYRECSPAGTPVMTQRTYVQLDTQLTTPISVIREHIAEWVEDWDPWTGLPY